MTFSNSFAYLNNQEKLLIKSAFTKYEKDISYFSANEQMRKIELITQKISDLQNTTKIKNNQVLYDVLSELDMLFQDKYSTLNSQNKYVESSVMKNLLCEQL
ncbi:MAG: hypothetical protein LBQ24_00975 [Candidatus Peribacteria bacterium]|nr:hypothetical protein [Candidatus Peribacteria bacterium]